MGFNLQLLFTGIGVGSIYALVSLGFALIYRATNVVNFVPGRFRWGGRLRHGGAGGRFRAALLNWLSI
jgi:branched-subunit amino acid ABC-type transport system permease component